MGKRSLDAFFNVATKPEVVPSIFKKWQVRVVHVVRTIHAHMFGFREL
jgi:hypothetical protein